MRLIRAALLLVLSSCPLSAQPLPDQPELPDTAKIPAIVEAYRDYFAKVGTARGSGYRPQQRRQAFVLPRSYPAGDTINLGALTWLNHFRAATAPQFQARHAAAAAAGIATANWAPVRPAEEQPGADSGRVDAIAFDPSEPATVYIGTPGAGVWVTRDDGATWTSLTDALPMLAVSDIAVDPRAPKTIYILTGDGDGGDPFPSPSIGVLKSVDGGETWQQTGLTWRVNEARLGHRLAIHPTDTKIVLAATTAGLFRTADGGDTWAAVAQADRRNPFWDVQFHPGNPSIIYAASRTTVYRSMDTGQTWTALANGLPNGARSTRIRLAVSPAGPESLYVLYAARDGFSLGLYRSDDAGNTFTRRSNSNPVPTDPNNPPPFDLTKPNILHEFNNYNGRQAAYDLALAVSPSNVDRVHIGALDTWRSDDGGRTWKITSEWRADVGSPNYTHADIHALGFRGDTLFVGSDGGLYRSDDGQTWKSVADIPGGGIRMIYSMCTTPADPNLLYYGTQDNGTWRLRLDGKLDKVLGGDGMVCQIHANDPELVYASVYFGNIYLSSNGGERFQGPIQPTSAGEGAWVTPYVLGLTDPDTLYACFADLWFGINNGGEWSNLSKGALGPNEECVAVVLAPSDPETIYVAKQGSFSAWNRPGQGNLPPFLGGGGVFRSSDGGKTWETVTGPLPLAEAALTSLAVSPTDPRRAWVTFSGYRDGNKVFATTDGGRTWTNISAGLPNLPANVVAAQKSPNNAVYVGTDVGVYYRDDRINAWVPFTDGMPNVVVTSLVVDDAGQRIFAGTYGRGIWRSELACQQNCNTPLRSRLGPAPPMSGRYTGPLEIFE